MSAMRLIYGNEKGMVLPVGLIFLAIIAILGTTAVIVTTTDLKIGSNYRASEQAFYAAEAGLEEARARLKADADDPITIIHKDVFIGLASKAQGKGYDPEKHGLYTSLSDLDYIVEIKHQTDTSGNILYWGDSNGDGVNERNTTTGENIYLVTSYGSSGASTKTIEVEMTRVPPVTAPAALYVEASTKIQGSSTNIIGTDSCGTDNKPGIATTKPIIDPDDGKDTITTAGNPTITGVGGGNPDVSYNTTNMDVQSVVDSFKGDANFAYTVSSATHTGTDTPGPGDDWGTPTPNVSGDLWDPSSCSDTNIVYYNTQGTSIKLSGGVTGCGILLVDGDLDMHGGFSWHGMVIVTGSVIFLGGGDKNITGALIAGGSVDADIIGGNSNIVYCSSAIDDQTKNRSLLILNWKENM